jgi:hypothetical protein
LHPDTLIYPQLKPFTLTNFWLLRQNSPQAVFKRLPAGRQARPYCRADIGNFCS